MDFVDRNALAEFLKEEECLASLDDLERIAYDFKREKAEVIEERQERRNQVAQLGQLNKELKVCLALVAMLNQKSLQQIPAGMEQVNQAVDAPPIDDQPEELLKKLSQAIELAIEDFERPIFTISGSVVTADQLGGLKPFARKPSPNITMYETSWNKKGRPAEMPQLEFAKKVAQALEKCHVDPTTTSADVGGKYCKILEKLLQLCGEPKSDTQPMARKALQALREAAK